MPVAKGQGHYAAKLSERQVAEVRELYGSACPCCGSRITGAMLAKRYGVSHVTIHHAAKGNTYRGDEKGKGNA